MEIEKKGRIKIMNIINANYMHLYLRNVNDHSSANLAVNGLNDPKIFEFILPEDRTIFKILEMKYIFYARMPRANWHEFKTKELFGVKLKKEAGIIYQFVHRGEVTHEQKIVDYGDMCEKIGKLRPQSISEDGEIKKIILHSAPNSLVLTRDSMIRIIVQDDLSKFEEVNVKALGSCLI